MSNLYALAQAGYTQPKDSYTAAELARFSTSHLRRLGRERLGVNARRHQRDSRNLPVARYWITDQQTGFVVAEICADEDDLREWLIENLAD